MAIKLTHMESIVLHQLARCNINFISRLRAPWHIPLDPWRFWPFWLAAATDALIWLIFGVAPDNTTSFPSSLPSVCDAEKVTYALCTPFILTILNAAAILFSFLSSFHHRNILAIVRIWAATIHWDTLPNWADLLCWQFGLVRLIDFPKIRLHETHVHE